MTEDKAVPAENTDMSTLKKKIKRQIEFYFGDYNLMKDKFMRQKMKENDGWFTMELMLQFKRLASICSEPTTILEALADADKTLLEIDCENQQIRRKINRTIPEDNEEFRKAFHARTVHVKGFQSEENIDDIHDFLSEYGTIDGIHLQRLPNRKFKGSLLVTFKQQEDATKFIAAPMVYYKGTAELTKISRNDFYQQLEQDKKKKTHKSEQQENEKRKGLIALKVSGITDDTIIHTDIKEVFQSKGIQNIVFFDRFEKLGSEGYLIFRSDDSADTILKMAGFVDSATATVKSSTIEFSSPNEEEKESLLKLYIQTKERFNQPNKRGRSQKKYSSKKQHRGKKTTFDSDGEGEKESGEPKQKAIKLE